MSPGRMTRAPIISIIGEISSTLGLLDPLVQREIFTVLTPEASESAAPLPYCSFALLRARITESKKFSISANYH